MLLWIGIFLGADWVFPSLMSKHSDSISFVLSLHISSIRIPVYIPNRVVLNNSSSSWMWHRRSKSILLLRGWLASWWEFVFRGKGKVAPKPFRGFDWMMPLLKAQLNNEPISFSFPKTVFLDRFWGTITWSKYSLNVGSVSYTHLTLPTILLV